MKKKSKPSPSLHINLIGLFAVLFFVTGCFGNLSYKLYDQFEDMSPNVIYVAPIQWDYKKDSDSKDEALELLDYLVREKLKSLGYKVSDSDEGVDAELYMTVTHWKESLFPTYGALKIGFFFEMVSGYNSGDEDDYEAGSTIWKAKFTSKDFDMRWDTTQMEMGIIKAFEPRIQRAVDTTFTTLPEAKFSEVEKKYFDWLP